MAFRAAKYKNPAFEKEFLTDSGSNILPLLGEIVQIVKSLREHDARSGFTGATATLKIQIVQRHATL